MGAHIVGAFEGMDEIGGTVGNQFIKECLEVMPYVRGMIIYELPRRASAAFIRSAIETPKGHLDSQVLQEMQSFPFLCSSL